MLHVEICRFFQHPYIDSVELCLCNDTGALVSRRCHKDGSLRDFMYGSKPRQTFLKKYGNPKGHKSLTIDQICLYGRQILEALKFLYDKGLPYGKFLFLKYSMYLKVLFVLS